MITEEQFPGNISILEVPRALDTMLPIYTDPVIPQRLPEPSPLAELEMMTGPGLLCAAL